MMAPPTEEQAAILAGKEALVRARSWLRMVKPATSRQQLAADAAEEYITAAIQTCNELLRPVRKP
jgi:hypothetical protein